MGERKRRRELYTRIKRATVAIVAASPDLYAKWLDNSILDADPSWEQLQIIGTGFLASKTGLIVTARHVMEDWRKECDIAQHENRPLRWQICVLTYRPAVGVPDYLHGTERFLTPIRAGLSNVVHDVSVVRLSTIEYFEDVEPLDIASDACDEGDDLIICGFPQGNALHADVMVGHPVTSSFSSAIVSAVLPYKDCPVEERRVFQVNGDIHPGNSGGPIVDVHTGEVVGIMESQASQPVFPLQIRPEVVFLRPEHERSTFLHGLMQQFPQIPPNLMSANEIRLPWGLGRGVEASVLRNCVEDAERDLPPTDSGSTQGGSSTNASSGQGAAGTAS
jgi:hypothetical protein